MSGIVLTWRTSHVSARLRSPSTARNRTPILEVLGPVCTEIARAKATGTNGETELGEVRVLEIASGSGEHAAYLATELPFVVWQPSERDMTGLASIDAWRLEERVGNVLPPLCLDATTPFRFPSANMTEVVFDGLVCINMIHISPWEATVGLFDNARACVRPGGFVFTYGPYRRGGAHTAESNARFDAELRVRNPRWGVRDLEEVVDVAKAKGFSLERVVEMPRDNLSLVFRRGPFEGQG